LRSLGIDFEVCAAKSDGPSQSDNPDERVLGHAEFKAREVAQLNPKRWVLAADTLVHGQGAFFGKPSDRQQARQMLIELQSMRQHQVFTGACLINPSGEMFSRVDCADVSFEPIGTAELENYLKSSEWCDKAGAYGIQGWASTYATCRNGDLETVIGLSRNAVSKLFVAAGFQL
jgi:septum formation protein